MDKNKHGYLLRKLLREIYSEPLLASELKFKGGTALTLFDGLPRFSTDLDFNLSHKDKQAGIYDRLMEIVSRNGKVFDSSNKAFGPLVVLDYGKFERKLKIEVSNRQFDNHYSLKPFGNILIPVMDKSDMFSHKLCAFLQRKAPRDVFDVWFFLSKGCSVNPNIIRERFDVSVPAFIDVCIEQISTINPSDMMKEIGELLDDNLKDFVRSGKILSVTEGMLMDFRAFPMVSEAPLSEHTKLLFSNDCLLSSLDKKNIDVSTVEVGTLKELLNGSSVSIFSKDGKLYDVCLIGGKVVFGKSIQQSPN